MSNTGWSRAAQDAAEAREVLYQSERLERFSATEERPRWLLTLSSVSICVAGGTALVLTWQTGGAIFCSVTKRLSGPNIPLAAHVVMIGCAVGLLLSIFLRARPLLLSLTLLLTACALVTGTALVAHDSAVTKAVESCSLMDTSTDTVVDHVWYVYLFWGVPSVVLLIQATRACLTIVGRPASPA
jgi:hypothetical protein